MNQGRYVKHFFWKYFREQQHLILLMCSCRTLSQGFKWTHWSLQENEILTEQEELLAMEQFLRRQIASEKEEIDRLRAEIAEIQR